MKFSLKKIIISTALSCVYVSLSLATRCLLFFHLLPIVFFYVLNLDINIWFVIVRIGCNRLNIARPLHALRFPPTNLCVYIYINVSPWCVCMRQKRLRVHIANKQQNKHVGRRKFVAEAALFIALRRLFWLADKITTMIHLSLLPNFIRKVK